MNLSALLYPDEAAAHFNVEPSTIRTWARRYPHLLPRHRDWRGRSRYRLADLLEVDKLTRLSR